MRITCPTCAAQYDVNENDIAFTGQEVQCSECMTVWTQTRSGEVENAHAADALIEEPEVEAVEPAQASPEWATISELAEETQAEADEISDVEEIEVEVQSKTAEANEEPKIEDEYPAPEEPVLVDEAVSPIVEDTPAEVTEDSVDETEANTKQDEPESADADYTPPDEMPPIQGAPAASDEAEPIFPAPDEDERPWETEEIRDDELTGFVWSDPTKAETDEDIAEPAHTDDDEKPDPVDDSSTFEDAANGSLEEIDDSDIARALKAQMEIEDELESNPEQAKRDLEAVPEELGGRRSRAPDMDALKSSVRAKSVDLTKDELQEAKPARRFRRGFVLTLVLFAALAAVYVLRGQIGEAIPAVQPYLETYATLVDTLRAQAEGLVNTAWALILQGFDWVMAKISG